MDRQILFFLIWLVPLADLQAVGKDLLLVTRFALLYPLSIPVLRSSSTGQRVEQEKREQGCTGESRLSAIYASEGLRLCLSLGGRLQRTDNPLLASFLEAWPMAEGDAHTKKTRSAAAWQQRRYATSPRNGQI
ncbi:13811_t:CDS:2 [Acaulospora colombiana]|uniref:13811_t:CDS:1 n=1 Tax=Acaulospora colombiana TaxID=27376 RepID=A0ACA9MLK6_9GLOM|nr:13811_t:CDS:2 [Acaulospora colombiana]